MGSGASVAKSKETNSQAGPRQFHGYCGKNVDMSKDCKTACGLKKERGVYNMVFSGDPLLDKDTFAVKVNEGKGRIVLGLTSRQPPRGCKPLETYSHGHLLGRRAKNWHSFGREDYILEEEFLELFLANEGDIIGVSRSYAGYCDIYINEKHWCRIFFTDTIIAPIWVMVDLFETKRISVTPWKDHPLHDEGKVRERRYQLSEGDIERLFPDSDQYNTKHSSWHALKHTARKDESALLQTALQESEKEFCREWREKQDSLDTCFEEVTPITNPNAPTMYPEYSSARHGTGGFLPPLERSRTKLDVAGAHTLGRESRTPRTTFRTSLPRLVRSHTTIGATWSSERCTYRDICHRYKESLGIVDDFFDTTFDSCYCQTCHGRKDDSAHYTRGIPAKTYGLPLGWVRFGLRETPRAKAMKVFDVWHVAFHGTPAKNLLSILQCGDLLLPGDVPLGREAIRPPLGHFTEDRRPAGFNIYQVFVSPSVKYAGLPAYAPWEGWRDPQTEKHYAVKVALQLRIKPSSYKVGPQTVGVAWDIDSMFSNSELEWSTNERGATIPTGLLVHANEL